MGNTRLSKAIAASGFQKKKIAEIAGVSRVMMTAYIKEGAQPRVDKAIKIARFLNLQVTDLFGEETNGFNKN